MTEIMIKDDLSKSTVIDLGFGQWLIMNSIIEGCPVMIFSPAKTPGEVGADGSHELTEGGTLPEGSVILRFGNPAAVEAHMTRIHMMMTKFIQTMAKIEPDEA